MESGMNGLSETVAVVGGGSWGTALANAAAAAGRPVTLWMRDAQAAARIQEDRVNARYLPGVGLHPKVRATAEAGLLAEAGTVLLVVPAQTLRGVLAALYLLGMALGGAIGDPLNGTIFDLVNGYRPLFLVMAGYTTLAFLTVLMIPRGTGEAGTGPDAA